MKPDYAENSSLYSPQGGRKYLNADERIRALAAMSLLGPKQALFALTLAWTGARVSEVLALTASSFQVERGIVSIRTLKRRKQSTREVPLPPYLVLELDQHFCLTTRRESELTSAPLWNWHRVTAWRVVKGVMKSCGIAGTRACPRGLRHAFGVGALHAHIPLNLLQRWLGHARMSTTALYADACGPDETEIARRMWANWPTPHLVD